MYFCTPAQHTECPVTRRKPSGSKNPSIRKPRRVRVPVSAERVLSSQRSNTERRCPQGQNHHSAWETWALSKEKASSRLRWLREPGLRRWPRPVRPPYALPAVILSGQGAPRPCQSLKSWNNHDPMRCQPCTRAPQEDEGRPVSAGSGAGKPSWPRGSGAGQVCGRGLRRPQGPHTVPPPSALPEVPLARP